MVIALLGVLATLILFSVRNISPNTRDSRRKQDLDQIRNALEIYYTDNESYPGSIQFGGTLNDSSGKIYMQKIPLDPKPTGYNYVYDVDDARQSYILYACIEDPESRDDYTEITDVGIDCGTLCDSHCWLPVESPGK